MSPLSRREILRRGIVISSVVISGGWLLPSEGNPTESTTQTPATTSSDQTESLAPTETELNNSSNTTVTPNPTDPIELDCHNETDEEQTVQYSITRDSTTVSEGEVQVPARGFSSVQLDIKRMGEYELNVTVNNIDEVIYPFDIEEYDLRMGSNLVVWIYEEKIEVGMEQ